MRIDPAVVRRLHARARAERWRVSMDRLAQALSESADRAFSGTAASTDEIERYLNGLHLEDLALACACMTGDEEAWEHLVREYRPALYRMANAVDPAGGARELADSLFGELFGATLLRYFHGRSSLATWLRSVLAQRVVGRVRVIRREQALPNEESADALATVERPGDPERERHITLMHAALGSAIAALDARDRLRLGCYYAEELTLAETGRILHEHEATVSRQLARTRKEVKADVERQLRDAGLTPEAIVECFASVAADPGPLDLRELVVLADPLDRKGFRKETAGLHSKKEQRV